MARDRPARPPSSPPEFSRAAPGGRCFRRDRVARADTVGRRDGALAGEGMAEPRTGYTHGHHESVLRSHRWRTAENSAAYLLGRLRPGMSLLDVGCGPGTIPADLAARVAPG